MKGGVSHTKSIYSIGYFRVLDNMLKDNLIRIGERRIQKLNRIALGKRESEKENLKEGDLVEVFVRRIS